MNDPELESGAARWKPLRPFIAIEARLSARAARGRFSAPFYEFLRFGIKQGWACLFGGIMVALLIGTSRFYPAGAMLSRYDFLFLSAAFVQITLLSLRLETMEEAKVILLYHVIGTVMEVFKTAEGSWIYPEPAFFRIAGVPLFSGFMYACIGSYLARVWRLFEFRFAAHPPLPALAFLSLAIYVNFFSHHFGPDFRWLLFGLTALLFFRTTIFFRVWREYRSMPMLVGLLLVTVFIWLAENVGTYTRTWLYPDQHGQWHAVSAGKFGSWFLLLIVSYTLVAWVNGVVVISRSSESLERA